MERSSDYHAAIGDNPHRRRCDACPDRHLLRTAVPEHALRGIFCSLGGYAFAQLKVPGKGLLYALFLVGLTIPFETLVTPLYYEISDMGLLNTRLALILPLIGLNIPFGIVWMRSCFEQMPRDLIEAASIDGAGHFRIFRSIQLSRPWVF